MMKTGGEYVLRSGFMQSPCPWASLCHRSCAARRRAAACSSVTRKSFMHLPSSLIYLLYKHILEILSLHIYDASNVMSSLIWKKFSNSVSLIMLMWICCLRPARCFNSLWPKLSNSCIPKWCRLKGAGDGAAPHAELSKSRHAALGSLADKEMFLSKLSFIFILRQLFSLQVLFWP